MVLLPLGGRAHRRWGGGFGIGIVGLVYLWLEPVVVAIVFVVLWGLVAHFTLLLATSEHQRLGRIYQAVCYIVGTTVVGVSVISQWPTVDVLVGRADQAIVKIPEEVFESDLEKQNQLQVSLQLPAIPHLSTVTHARPAVSDGDP